MTMYLTRKENGERCGARLPCKDCFHKKSSPVVIAFPTGSDTYQTHTLTTDGEKEEESEEEHAKQRSYINQKHRLVVWLKELSLESGQQQG